MAIKGVDIIEGRQAIDSELVQVGNMRQRKAKFLILDPNSHYVTRRAEEAGSKVEPHRKEIQHALETLAVLDEHVEELSIEKRIYDFMPIWNLLFIDNVLFLSFYLKGVRGPESICLQIRRPSPLFLAFNVYFDETWKKSTSG